MPAAIDPKFDVAVLGTGIAGSLLSCVLAKHGVRVLMLDAFSHPRFAVGESMVSESHQYLALIAKRFGLEEASNLTHPRLLSAQIAPTSGVKLNFGFIHNREGEQHRPEHMMMTPLLTPETHMYRQDVDAYLFHRAIHHGAAAIQNARVREIELGASGVSLQGDRGERWDARFLVDASGYRSPLAAKLGLRVEADAIETHARSLFTHMIDVLPYEQSVMSRAAHGLPLNFFQGTLHHVFEGGWLWVIPFNNHRLSTNPLCSVGLQLDPRIYGPPQDPEREFAGFLERYPPVARQFRGARRVREWVVAPRLQYKSTRSAGDRYCLLAHASGFIDPLYSRGMVISFEAINNLAPRLIEAVRTDEFHRERFAPIAEMMERATDVNDQLVASSYSAFRDFDLWNAFYRIWVYGALLGAQRLRTVVALHDPDDDAETTRRLEDRACMGSMSRGYAPFEALFARSVGLVREVHGGVRSPSDASAAIFKLLRDAEASNALPPIDMANPAKRLPLIPEPHEIQKLLAWGKYDAPEELRASHFGAPAVAPMDVGADLRLDLG
jgi:tetracycline 7-halogenase / FADH2 O2-dependent halogenase